MTSIKIKRAFAIAKIGNYPLTREHIICNIFAKNDRSVINKMSSKQLAVVIIAADYSYLNAKSDTQNDK